MTKLFLYPKVRDTIGVSVEGEYGKSAFTSNIRRLPFRSGVVDTVLGGSVLAHVEDPQQAMAELARVLRPGGVLVLMLPQDCVFSRLLRCRRRLGIPDVRRWMWESGIEFAHVVHLGHFLSPRIAMVGRCSQVAA